MTRIHERGRDEDKREVCLDRQKGSEKRQSLEMGHTERERESDVTEMTLSNA